MRQTITILFVALMLGGCAMPKAGPSLTKDFGKDDPESQLEFWHRLGDKPMTTNDDAFHGLLLYLDGKDASADYAARVSTLKSRKLLPSGFDRPGDEAIQRGTLAIALIKATKMPG